MWGQREQRTRLPKAVRKLQVSLRTVLWRAREKQKGRQRPQEKLALPKRQGLQEKLSLLRRQEFQEKLLPAELPEQKQLQVELLGQGQLQAKFPHLLRPERQLSVR